MNDSPPPYPGINPSVPPQQQPGMQPNLQPGQQPAYNPMYPSVPSYGAGDPYAAQNIGYSPYPPQQQGGAGYPNPYGQPPAYAPGMYPNANYSGAMGFVQPPPYSSVDKKSQ